MRDNERQQGAYLPKGCRARWETATRWYEVFVGCDLLGDWTITRCWGGKDSRRHGFKVDVAASKADAYAQIEQIHKRRVARQSPYTRVR